MKNNTGKKNNKKTHQTHQHNQLLMEVGCYSLVSHSTKLKLTTRHCNVRKRYDFCSYLIIFNIKFGLGDDCLLMCSDVEAKR